MRVIVAGAAMSAVALAGCGGEEAQEPASQDTDATTADEGDDEGADVSDDEPSTEDQPSTEVDPDTDEDTDGTTDTQQQEDEDAGDGGEASLSQLRDVLAGAQPDATQVVYDVTAPGAYGTGRMTLAFDRPRMATVFDTDELSIVSLTDGSSIITCHEDASGWQCIEMGGGDGDPESMLEELPGLEDLETDDAPRLDGLDADELDDDDVADVSRATILDRSALCVTMTADAGDMGDVETCFDEQTGLLLRTTATDADGNAFSMEAIEIGSPDEGIFDPPAEPEQRGDMFEDLEDLEGLEDMDLEGLTGQG